MASSVATNAVTSTWPNKNYLELDKEGVYPLNGAVANKESSTLIASATINPLHAFTYVNMAGSAGNVTLTFPATASMGPYVGRRYVVYGNSHAANQLIVTSTGADFLGAGDVSTTTLTCAAALPCVLEFFVAATDRILVLTPFTYAAAMAVLT